MIITINADHKVISRAVGKIFDNAPVDNKTTFRVGVVESVDENGEHVVVYEAVEPVFNPDTEELYFNPKTMEFFTKTKPNIKTLTEEERQAIRKALQAKAHALQWLADNDWKPNKIIRKEWTEDDPRWIEYLNKSLEMRTIIDRSDCIIRGEENE